VLGEWVEIGSWFYIGLVEATLDGDRYVASEF
jgi:hypothetical protein